MTETCLITECTSSPVNIRGWCSKHYQRWRKYGDPLFTKQHDGAKCSVEDCTDDAKKKGMCKLHYQRKSRTGSTDPHGRRFVGTTVERFWNYIEKQENECWQWTGPVCDNGRLRSDKYPNLWVSELGKFVRAHIWSYRNWVGEYPDVFEIDHKCCNTLCVNPEHLEAVPPAINKDRIWTNRLKTVKTGQVRVIKL